MLQPFFSPSLHDAVTRWLGWSALIAWLVAGLPAAAASQPATTQDSAKPLVPVAPAPDPLVNVEQVTSLRKALESDMTLDDAGKTRVGELLDQAANSLQESQTFNNELTRLKELLNNADRRIADIQQQLTSPAKDEAAIAKLLAAPDLDQLNVKISQYEVTLVQTRDQLKIHEAELTRLLVGSKGLLEQVSQNLKTVEDIDRDLQTQSTNEASIAAQARLLALNARKQLRLMENTVYKLRIGNMDRLTNLIQAERDLKHQEINILQSNIEKLKLAAQQVREQQALSARQQAEAIKEKSAELPAPVKILAEDNTHFREELESLVYQERQVQKQLESTQRQLEEIKAEFERTRQRVDVVGASEAIGRMLRRRRDALPSVQQYQRSTLKRGKAITVATDRHIDIDERLRELSDLNKTLSEITAQLPPNLSDRELQSITSVTTTLAQTRRDALNELQKVYSRYISELTTLDLAERRLVEVAESFIHYINEQLIWIPNASIVSLNDPIQSFKGFGWLFDWPYWKWVARDLLQVPAQIPFISFSYISALFFMWATRRNARNTLHLLAQKTRKIRTDGFLLTLMALWQVLALSLAWPSILIALGWGLYVLPTADPFSHAIAAGLINAGLMAASLNLFQHLCRRDSLGDRHWRWPEAVRHDLLRELRWFIAVGPVLGFIVHSTSGVVSSLSTHHLGRISFVVLMLSLAVFSARLLHRNHAIFRCLIAHEEAGWIERLHFLWYPLTLGIPVALAITSLLGYHYTALHLEERLQQTLWFFFGLFILKELLLRALYIAERRLRYEDALKRRDDLRAQRSHESPESFEEPAHQLATDIPELDFDQLSEQNRRLTHAGFLFGLILGTWAIWNDLLPALTFLNRVELPFEAARIVDGVTKSIPVTLGDLVVGLMIAMITILAAKNLPGLMEITLLQRLPLEPGARYAVTSLSQYVIVGIGVFSAFSHIGLQWSNIQWLIAALSVGLGFGLQEIVANFISGIILLFERPIRVGDVVTIDNTTGVVSRIRIRATTITNYERQELLIPNKQFITGRVMNWTLTDKMNRISVKVGVDYGTDVTMAMALLLEAAEDNEMVLKDPKASAGFEGFGDNALNLVLRCYLGSMENRVATITALHQSIYCKFIAHNISISFPQRDVHLDTSRPLDVRVQPAESQELRAPLKQA